MLILTRLSGFGAGGGEAPAEFDISYISNNSVESVSSTTFSNQAIGDPHSTRMVVVGSAVNQSGSITSLTIGGISATQVTSGTGQNTVAELWYAAVPSGTTADIVINYSTTITRSRILVLRVVGLNSTTPVDTASGSGGGSSTRNLSIDAPEGGGVVVFAAGDEDDTEMTYTNATKLFELQTTFNTESCGSYVTTGASETDRTITISTCRALIAGAWA